LDFKVIGLKISKEDFTSSFSKLKIDIMKELVNRMKSESSL